MDSFAAFYLYSPIDMSVRVERFSIEHTFLRNQRGTPNAQTRDEI